MATIGLFYGSDTGNTEHAAKLIQNTLNGTDTVVLYNVAEGVSKMAEYEYLILGVPTWNIGELQGDWDDHMAEFEQLDFSGKKVAIYGLGDARGYPSTFVDGIGVLGEVVQRNGGQLVGFWPPDDYEFDDSRALLEPGNLDSGFMGLPLDEDNQSDLSEVRVEVWVGVIRQEFGL
ncbi:MAG: flavodoxin [Anaerolineae bacterium]|nr:flavodoxin [Anaerolineae bacterium]